MSKNLFKLFILMCCMFFTANAAFAHPPSKIEASVDGEMVNVTIMHNVKDRANHYIYKVVVTLNDKEIIDKRETRQLDDEKQVEVFEIPGLKAGDKLTVEATCNKYGSKTLELTVQ